MTNELIELLDTAMYKEVASQSFYSAALQKSVDPGAKALMKELAEGESRHYQRLQRLKERNWNKGQWHEKSIKDLGISEYLMEDDALNETSLQDTLIFAMKREQHAVEFYSKLMSALRSKEAKLLCERLVHEELKHKQRLELFYDELFYAED